jgi:hypothetical protein
MRETSEIRVPALYSPPVNTLIEVIPSETAKISFFIGTIPDISPGSVSFPVKVSVANAPYKDCTVVIAVSGKPEYVIVVPSVLLFTADVNESYFRVQVAVNYNPERGNAHSLLFSLSGIDCPAFYIVPFMNFTIVEQGKQATAVLTSWGLGVPTRNLVTVRPSTDQAGVLYYHLAATGTSIPSFPTLKASLESLLSSNSTKGFPEVQDNPGNETWTTWQHNIYRSHLQTAWTGALSLGSFSETMAFSWLAAGTTYEISGYIDNQGQIVPEVFTESFTTAEAPDCQPFTVTFEGNVSQIYEETVALEVARAMEVSRSQIKYSGYAPGRRAQAVPHAMTSTVFSFMLLSNRFTEGPDPSSQAILSSSAYDSLVSGLKANDIPNQLTSLTSTPLPLRQIPQWTTSPRLSQLTSHSIRVILGSNLPGEVCCIASVSAFVPTPQQVTLGLDAFNVNASFACKENSRDSALLQIEDLQPATTYTVFCTAGDSYPLWPTLLSDMQPVKVVTAAMTEESADWLMSGMWLAVWF